MREAKPEWFNEHELDDVQRHGQLMGAIATVSTRLDGLAASMNKMDARQWEERPSAITTMPDTPTAKSNHPLAKNQAGTLAAMVGTMVILGEVIKELVKALVSH